MDNCLAHNNLAAISAEPLQIDLPGVLRCKLGDRRMRLVPRWLVRWLERLICVPRMNGLLRATYPATGGDFARRVLEELDVKIRVVNPDSLPDLSRRRVMLVSNHPLGGVEGMALIHLMSRHYGGRVYVMVNDVLMAIKPLREVFLPVNKHGHQDEAVLRRVDRVMAGDDPILIFPAGLVSRLLPGQDVHDLPWRPTFVNLALRHRRTVVPVFCGGRNSMFFYRFARLREALGIRLNIEMVRLPREVFKQEGKTLPVAIGRPIAPGELEGGAGVRATADRICRLVYKLGEEAGIRP